MNRRASTTLSFLFLFALLAAIGLSPGPLAETARAQGSDPASTADISDPEAILEDMPATLPDNYTDEEIDRMLEDIEAVEETPDPESEKAATPPELTESEARLLDEVKNDPDRYYDSVRTTVWLDTNYRVIWHLCSDFAWIEAHPRFAARIYVNYRYWQRYPAIAYIIVLNRPFLVRYPRISLVIYEHDTWFVGHPYIAREIYLNHVIFHRYPALVHRYYRHKEWMHRHPRVARAAYGNRRVVKAYPHYRGNAYQYRRHAVEKRLISPPHMKKIHERRGDDLRRRDAAAKARKADPKTVRDRRPDKDRREGDRGRVEDSKRRDGDRVERRERPKGERDRGRSDGTRVERRERPSSDREGGRSGEVNRREVDGGRAGAPEKNPGNGGTRGADSRGERGGKAR